MAISKETMISMYEKMLLSRRVDEKIIELYRAGLPGMIHLCLGEEAVAVGVCGALNNDDYVLSTHRGKGHYIAKGGNLKALIAELMAKKTGSNKGKGGAMHIIDPSVGMLGANGIVGSSLPIACGVALSVKLRGSQQVTVGFFGDGAANSGPCHESMNLAGIWKLPLVLVCENNYYQVSVPLSRHSSVQDFYIRAAGYGIPGYKVDGMDVVAVYEATYEAVLRARNGEGATLLECKTYRFRGHAESDPTRGLAYRCEEEIASWEEKDPIKRAREFLLDKEWITENDLEEMDHRCRQEIEEAVAFAQNSEDVPPEWALTDVFKS
ncbi:MAG: thiamine pyrophosphate-dependent dehydrogenase E1 component subunit alpha [Deltaproteobacteria bacterium]|nr:thiamine pyrophosphate-dependent dehydrogenase E1 component subunit alpha [Deltaproteobacteria bacterium]